MIAPARRAAFEVVRRVFEDERLRRSRAGLGGRRARHARPRARAADRVRDGAARAHDRPRHRRARPAAGAQARPGRASRRCGSPGYELAWSDAAAYAVADDAVELVRAAGLERAVGFTNAVARRLAEGFRALVASLPRRAARGVVSRLDLGDVGARLGRGRGARARPRAERAGASSSSARPSPVGEPTDVPGRVARRARRPGAARGRPHLAAEPRLAARGARRRLAGRRARARRVRRAGRQGDDAARRGDRGRAASGPRPRAGGERPPPRRDERPRRQRRRPRARRDAASTGRSSTRRARASASSAAAPTCAGARSRCPSCSSSCCAPRPSGRARAGRSSTRSAR